MDDKMIETGLCDSPDVAKSEYISYIRNGLMTQLTRIDYGKNLEEAHMRNRQLIAKWVFEKGKEEKIIERKIRDKKTYFVINDYKKLRELFGILLREIQRIKSEGDYEAGKNIVEKYGVEVDRNLHKEVKERYEKLKLSPYSGFVNPQFIPVIKNNKITDIKLEYPDNYMEQMLRYSNEYSFLPTYN
jgi:dipeptidyl-peptidase III